MFKYLWAGAGVVIGAAVAWWALQSVEWGEVAQSLAKMDWTPVILAGGAILLASLLEAIRWKLFLPAADVSAKRLFFVKFVGKGLNNISPVRIVSEVAQTTILRYGDGVSLDKIVSSLLLVRLADVLVTVSLVGGGLIVLPQLSGLRPIVLPLWGLSVASVAILLLMAKRLPTIPGISRFPLFKPLLVALGVAGSRRKVLFAGLLLTVMSWMSIGTAAWLVGNAAGVDLPFWLMAIVIVAVSFVSSALPAPPGSIGVYEFTAISTLGLFAVDPAQALTFALVIHALLVIPSLLIAAGVLAVERRTLQHVVMAVRQVVTFRKPAV